MSRGTVYAIENQDGKAYIGSTRNLKKRWRRHRSDLRRGHHGNPYLQRAWNKCGEQAFEFVVLEENIPTGQLIQREQCWLDKYRIMGEVYNCGVVAENAMMGCKHTIETRRKLSEAHQGKLHSEETRRKIGEAHQGMKRSKETCHNLSKAKCGERNPNYGKSPSKETRRRISEALRGKNRSEETCRKIGDANAGSYPAFYNIRTNTIILPGINLTEMCRKHKLGTSSMSAVIHGRRKSHQGWVLMESPQETEQALIDEGYASCSMEGRGEK